jgi:hypothetical protein
MDQLMALALQGDASKRREKKEAMQLLHAQLSNVCASLEGLNPACI